MKLSIVTPVYNNYRFTEQYLKDLIQLSNDHEIIIIDNASTDQTADVIKKYQLQHTSNRPEIIYIKNTENIGFARASNQGYKISRANNVLFLNNDIKVKSNFNNWTDKLIDNCNYLVGPTGGMLDADCNFIKETNKFEPASLFYMSGWCLASNKSNWEKLCKLQGHGPFPENLGHASYWEDTLASYRFIKLGVKFKLQEVPVHHFGRMTGRLVNLKELYTLARNDFIKIAGKDIKEGKVKCTVEI